MLFGSNLKSTYINGGAVRANAFLLCVEYGARHLQTMKQWTRRAGRKREREREGE